MIREDRLPMSEQFKILGEKLDLLHDMAGVPQRDIPTIDELIEQAKSDATKRKLLQNTLAELEFTDTEIEYQ